MTTIGKRHIEAIAVLGELPDHLRREARIGEQRRQHRRKVAPFAIDLDAERQLEPVDTAALELRIEGAGGNCRPIWKIVIDADFKTFGLQFRGATIEKIEPAACRLERQGLEV